MNKKKFEKMMSKYSKTQVVVKKTLISRPFFPGDVNTLFNAKKSLFHDEKIETLIENNFDRILAVREEDILPSIIDELAKRPTMMPFLTKNETMQKFISESSFSEFSSLLRGGELQKNFSSYIKENLDWFLENMPMDKICEADEFLVFSKEGKEKVSGYLKEHKSEYLRYRLGGKVSKIDEKSKDKLFAIVEKVVDKFAKLENREVTDFKILGGGAYSCVIGIGDVVIKVGQPRRTFNMPNHSRILQPHMRKDLSQEYGIPAVIEVSDRVDTESIIDNEEMYQIYKEMREKGIVCADMSHSNIGRLLKSNTPKSDNNNGLHGSVDTVLKSGEYVILDTDFIFRENDKSIDFQSFSAASQVYEKRYRQEKGLDVKREETPKQEASAKKGR